MTSIARNGISLLLLPWVSLLPSRFLRKVS